MCCNFENTKNSTLTSLCYFFFAVALNPTANSLKLALLSRSLRGPRGTAAAQAFLRASHTPVIETVNDSTLGRLFFLNVTRKE